MKSGLPIFQCQHDNSHIYLEKEQFDNHKEVCLNHSHKNREKKLPLSRQEVRPEKLKISTKLDVEEKNRLSMTSAHDIDLKTKKQNST